MKWKCPKCGREFSRRDQDHYCMKPQTIDEYIALQDEAVQSRLREVRAIIHAAIPDAKERISWSMPTYWKGKNLIHFAASKKHLGLYPGGEATIFRKLRRSLQKRNGRRNTWSVAADVVMLPAFYVYMDFSLWYTARR